MPPPLTPTPFDPVWAAGALEGPPWLTRHQIRDVCGVSALDGRIGKLATYQGGAVSLEQLGVLGGSEKAVRVRRKSRRLVRLHHRVYAVGHEALTLRGRAIAALLAVPGSVLSHRSAAALHDLRPDDLDRPHVTTTSMGAGSHKNIQVHRTRSLSPDEQRSVEGLPVTSVERTLLDLAEDLPGELPQAVREARIRKGVEPDAVRAMMARHTGRRGVRRLEEILSGPESEPTRSATERRRLPSLARTDRPRPQVNVVVRGRRRDFAWPEQRLILEVDAYSTHGDRATFESDRQRDNSVAMDDRLGARSALPPKAASRPSVARGADAR